MAEKGETEENIFKLTVQVNLLTKGSNENTVEQLQKCFQKELVHLRQYFKDHAQLHAELVYSVIKEKMNLEFEFWVQNKEDLEKLKKSIEDGTLAKTLSEYSCKKGLHTKHWFLLTEAFCFRCTIMENRASDSDNEGTEEKDVIMKDYRKFASHEDLSSLFQKIKSKH